MLLAHVTPQEFPIGAALFIAGVSVGIGVAVGMYLGKFRSR
jgi:hypothetical protein